MQIFLLNFKIKYFYHLRFSDINFAILSNKVVVWYFPKKYFYVDATIGFANMNPSEVSITWNINFASCYIKHWSYLNGLGSSWITVNPVFVGPTRPNLVWAEMVEVSSECLAGWLLVDCTTTASLFYSVPHTHWHAVLKVQNKIWIFIKFRSYNMILLQCVLNLVESCGST